MPDNMTTVTMSYDGEPVRDGSMDVHALGNALLAIGDLLNAANRTLNKDQTVLDVTVRAEFKKGSFGFDIGAHQTTADMVFAISPVLYPQGLKTAADIIKFVFEKGTGLVDFLRKLGGKAPEKVVPSHETGTVRVELTGSPNSPVTIINIPRETAELYNDPSARKALERVLRPLRADGMETFEVLNKDGELLEEVTAEEVKYFEAPNPADLQETLHDDTHTAIYEVISMSFYSGKGWRLSTNGPKKAIPVDIEDADFLARIARHEVSFVRGVALKVQIRTIQKRKEGGLDTRYKAILVLEVIHFDPPQQTTFLMQPPKE